MTDSARTLARTIKRKHREGMIKVATIRSIQDYEDHNLVECEIGVLSETDSDDQVDLGSFVNAWIWGQGEVQVGDKIMITRFHGTHHWVAIGSQSYARGERAKTRDPEPIKHLYNGDGFRVRKIPRNVGGKFFINRTERSLKTSRVTYAELSCTIKFDKAFNINRIPSRLEFRLLGTDVDNPDYDNPSFSLPINTVIDNTKLRGSIYFSQDAWLDSQDEVLFMLACYRVNAGTVDTIDAGRIRRVTLKFNADPQIYLITTTGLGIANNDIHEYDVIKGVV